MLANYFGFIVLGLIGIALAAVFTIIGIILGKKSNNAIKLQPFETGLSYLPSTKNVHVKFYLVAMVFLIFDVEVALLFPYALLINELQLVGFFSVMLFLTILIVGILYEFKNKLLDW